MKKNIRFGVIFDLLEREKTVGVADIIKKVGTDTGKKVSKITINRDLKKLLDQKLIIRIGKGPAIRYAVSSARKLFEEIDVEKYFKDESENRAAIKNFNFDIFDALESADIFNCSERDLLSGLNEKFQENIKKLPADIIKKEYERLTIELSWKSSRIEGNTYSLLETENLLKNRQDAVGHTKEEAVMITNHKEALEYIKNNPDDFRDITISKVEGVHFLLTEGLNIDRNIRKRAVGITGTPYVPLGNEFQIKEALEKMCTLINNKENVFAKALLLNLLIAYIQPFNDGNKRTGRLMGNAVLMARGFCPLSYRSIDELEYKKAVILFYEQNNFRYFKKLFIEQFEFAVNNYFLA